jgi:hypothetical protein
MAALVSGSPRSGLGNVLLLQPGHDIVESAGSCHPRAVTRIHIGPDSPTRWPPMPRHGRVRAACSGIQFYVALIAVATFFTGGQPSQVSHPQHGRVAATRRSSSGRCPLTYGDHQRRRADHRGISDIATRAAVVVRPSKLMLHSSSSDAAPPSVPRLMTTVEDACDSDSCRRGGSWIHG